jgi:ComF family protein
VENISDRKTILNKCFEAILDFVFPKICVNCSEEGFHLCPKCASKITKIKTNHCLFCQRIAPRGICSKCKPKLPVEGIYSLGYYRDPILRQAIQELKYQGIRDIAKSLCEIYSSVIQELKLPENSILIPVPLHKTRSNERGFNQSQLIAKCLSENSHWQLQTNLIVRTKNTQPQAKLSPKDRESNIQNAFLLNKNSVIPPNIILIDDVITTGSTIKECVKILRPHCQKIFILTLARG